MIPDSRIRITANPNYTFPDATGAAAAVATRHTEMTCFDNPNHIQLPHNDAAAAVAVAAATAIAQQHQLLPMVAIANEAPDSAFDSSTYNKRERPRST